jgi:hypothetical protein
MSWDGREEDEEDEVDVAVVGVVVGEGRDVDAETDTSDDTADAIPVEVGDDAMGGWTEAAEEEVSVAEIADEGVPDVR